MRVEHLKKEDTEEHDLTSCGEKHGIQNSMEAILACHRSTQLYSQIDDCLDKKFTRVAYPVACPQVPSREEFLGHEVRKKLMYR